MKSMSEFATVDDKDVIDLSSLKRGSFVFAYMKLGKVGKVSKSITKTTTTTKKTKKVAKASQVCPTVVEPIPNKPLSTFNWLNDTVEHYESSQSNWIRVVVVCR
jgi:hypothetical protein